MGEDRRIGTGWWRGALLVALATATLATACGGGESESGTAAGDGVQPVSVYIGRHYGIEPVFEEFTAATGIPVVFTTGKDAELRERIEVEGANTQADVYLAADAGNLQLAADEGLLAPVDSPVLAEAVPERVRAADGSWYALSLRNRTIITSTDRVPEADVPTSYEALGDPRWKGRLCLRPSTSAYTQSLVSSLIASRGEDGAREVVDSWVANEPTYIDSDEDMIEAVSAGQCDVAVINHYYVPRTVAEDGPIPVRLTWPTEPPGVHQNVSGAGVTANAANPEGARKLLEWLATDGQRSFADVNYEFPANPTVQPREELLAFGPYTVDPVAVREFGPLQAQAVRLLDAAGYQ